MERAPGIRGIGIAVPVADVQLVMTHEGADKIFGTQIYHRAFEGALLKATELACISGDKLAFVHDDGPDFDELFNLYQAFKKANVQTAKRMASLQSSNDKVTPALQIADIFANNIMGKTVEYIKGAEPNAADIFMYTRSKLYAWSKEFGELVLTANLEKRNLPVPESLSHLLPFILEVRG